MKLREIGEFGFIDRIAPLGAMRSQGVVKGIGDDCAVISLEGPEHLLVTTDLLVEGVHFLMEWAPAEVIGAKALAVNLSDIAACGGRPRDAFISLAIPESVTVEWLDGFYQGMSQTAQRYGVNLLGGDTTGSKQYLVINVAVTGLVPRHEVLFRHGARAGDIIVVSGPMGESGMGVEILLKRPDLPEEVTRPLIRAQLEPRPHIEEGRLLATSGACSAAIDMSDGLSSDLGHICKQSGVGALVYESCLHAGQELAAAAEAMGQNPLRWILGGGEDYVLIAAIKPDMLEEFLRRAEENRMTFLRIGEFTEQPGIQLVRSDGRITPLRASGWDHFA